MADKKEFLSVPEAAVLMGISRIAVFKKVKKGQLAAIRIGRNWAVPAAALKTPAPAVSQPRSFGLVAKTNGSVTPIDVNPGPKELGRPRSVAPEEPAPRKDSMDDIGWD